jgi:putative PIN family toxin of toxin-antitoxin system
VKVFLDTNVLVSAFTTRGLCADLFQALLADHTPCVGETVLSEFEKVLRGKFRHSAAAARERKEFLRRYCELSPAANAARIPGIDAQDRKVIGEAAAASVDALVTGDQAMLALGTVKGMAMVSPRQLWERLRRT